MDQTNSRQTHASKYCHTSISKWSAAESNICVSQVALCNSCQPSPKGAQCPLTTSCVNTCRLQDFHSFCPFVGSRDNTHSSNTERAEVEQVLNLPPCEPVLGGSSSEWAAVAAAVGIFTMLYPDSEELPGPCAELLSA